MQGVSDVFEAIDSAVFVSSNATARASGTLCATFTHVRYVAEALRNEILVLPVFLQSQDNAALTSFFVAKGE